ncbi:MAG: AIPR family protein [Bacteroidales bacterium]|nr:AIPR family protein [Bacteroidales bacterium]
MIKDLVLKSQFVNFLDSWGLKYSNTIEEAYAFEKFVNYLVLSQDDSSTFIGNPDLLDSCCVGGGEDAKLDGIGIKINGNLVGDIQDIEQIVDASKKIDVEFFLIQSKERSSFDSSEFNTFGIGAQYFFSDPKLPESQAIKSFRKMKDLIYSDTKVIRKLENNPSAHIVYAFCGTPPQDEHTEALKKIVKQNLESCPISLNEIRVEILGTTDLIRMSKEIANDYTIELTIKDIIPLTTFENKKIKKAYSFTCEAIELVKLLSKDDGTIRKSLFYENVRDYLGNQGGVNSEIEKTLKEEPEMFLMCNNGITIVCSDFNQIRDKLVSIQNPQIVNGCQTSHSIFHFRNSDSLKNVHVLVKIVCTDEYEITNKIVRGTNKQNQVLEESFETTKPFHQHLEDYFSARRDKVSLYYERRNKQYASNPTINKFEIANLRVITQTLVGMFLQSPHIAHRHEAKLLEMYNSQNEMYIIS